MKTSAEERILGMEAGYNDYQRSVSAEMRAAVERVAKGQALVVKLESEAQESKENLLEADARPRTEYERQAASSKAICQ